MIRAYWSPLCCLAGMAVAALGLGCGSPGTSETGQTQQTGAVQESSQKKAASTGDTEGAAQQLKGSELQQAGTLVGTVLFDGSEIIPQTMIPIRADEQYCGRHGKDGLYPAEDCLIDPETKGIRNVIVYLMDPALRNWPNTPRENIVVGNRNCRFEPHVNVSTVGSTVEVKNFDDVFHTTHLYGIGFPFQFNPALPTKGTAETTKLPRPGMHDVKCDKHGWMRAFLRVDSHPFHTITDETGQFEIAGIPPGTYQVGMFHEYFRPEPKDPERTEVTIEAGQRVSLDRKFSE